MSETDAGVQPDPTYLLQQFELTAVIEMALLAGQSSRRINDYLGIHPELRRALQQVGGSGEQRITHLGRTLLTASSAVAATTADNYADELHQLKTLDDLLRPLPQNLIICLAKLAGGKSDTIHAELQLITQSNGRILYDVGAISALARGLVPSPRMILEPPCFQIIEAAATCVAEIASNHLDHLAIVIKHSV